MEKGFLTRLLECAFLFLLSVILIQMGIDILTEIWLVLAIIAAILLAFVIAFRIWKYLRDTGKW